jgi:urease accessory protein
MLKAISILDEAAARAPSGTLTLPFERRQKSRLVAHLDSGQPITLLLPRGHVLRDGSLLEANDGSVIRVRSADEELSVVVSGNAAELLRAAYHLGNRHVALQIGPGRLAYLHDHVLDDMLRGLGLEPSVAREPFEPESGAYGRHGGHAHGHGDHHGHDHHGHDHPDHDDHLGRHDH